MVDEDVAAKVTWCKMTMQEHVQTDEVVSVDAIMGTRYRWADVDCSEADYQQLKETCTAWNSDEFNYLRAWNADRSVRDFRNFDYEI